MLPPMFAGVIYLIALADIGEEDGSSCCPFGSTDRHLELGDCYLHPLVYKHTVNLVDLEGHPVYIYVSTISRSTNSILNSSNEKTYKQPKNLKSRATPGELSAIPG